MKIDDRAVRMYEDDLLSLQMIGEYFGVTRQGVKKYLNKRGIDTSKRLYEVECTECGKKFKKHKAYIRNTYKITCGVECYYKRIENPNYNGSRQGQRVARRVVDELLMTMGRRLGSKDVVHHEDGDTTNNSLDNLVVFKNHSDHMTWHRGDRGLVEPILVCGKIPNAKKPTTDHIDDGGIQYDPFFKPMPKKGKSR